MSDARLWPKEFDEWLAVCNRARWYFDWEQYQKWMFAVGVQDTDAERAARGRRALEHMTTIEFASSLQWRRWRKLRQEDGWES